ncbi:MAG: lactate dehydrogenase [Methanoregula sp.]
MVRLAVMGVGRIGGEVAYLAASMGIADELVLYDNATELLMAQVLDLIHTGLDVAISTDEKDIRDADICIFSAGMPRNPTVRTRADLLSANLKANHECAGLLKNFSGVLITVTNPMDINNYILYTKSGIPRERCIGFGGQLDSARFGLALKKRGITGTPFVLGEHGEHQVPIFSTLSRNIDTTTREEILHELRNASMEVIRGKGGTVFGPAFHLIHLIRIILSDTPELLVCSTIPDGEYGLHGCSLGMPVRIDREGIREIQEWPLDTWEHEKMSEAGRFVAELTHKSGALI